MRWEESYLEEFSPRIQDLLKHPIDVRIQECSISAWRAHGIIQDGAQRHTNQPYAVRRISPLGRLAKDVVKDPQHVLVVPDLLRPRRIVDVRLLLRDLLEHHDEVHVDARVPLDERPELLDGRGEAALVLLEVQVGALRRSAEEFMVEAVVLGQPVTDSTL